MRGLKRETNSAIWTTHLRVRLVSHSKTRCFGQEYYTITQQLLLDWEYYFKHYNFRKKLTMFLREKDLWKRKLCGRSGMRFSSKNLCCQGKWAYLENPPRYALCWSISNKAAITVLFSEGEKRDYSVKLGKTTDCCKIMTPQFNGLYCVASCVKIWRKTNYRRGTARRTTVSW